MSDIPKFSVLLSNGTSEITISRNSIYRLISADGLESGDYNIFSSVNSQIHGASVISRHLRPRRIIIEFEASTPERGEMHRAELLSFFNPLRSGTLTVTRGSNVRSIKYIPEKAEFIQPTLFDALRIKATLFCADPFFTNPQDTAVSSRASVPMLSLPFNSLVGVGITAGLSVSTNTFTVNNSGDAEVGLTVSIRASGEVVNPFVRNEGREVRILDTMREGDVYEICTIPGAKRLSKNGVNVFNFDRKSEFFTLATGTSSVVIGADFGSDAITSSIVYNVKYLGI